MNRFAKGWETPRWLAPRADQGNPGGTAANDGAGKHQHADASDDFIEKDASTGTGSRHSRQSRQGSDNIDGKDGGLNRAGDERGWNASQQPRDAHGRFISEKDKMRTSPSTAINPEMKADGAGA